MTFQGALRTFLLTDATITGLVGTRIYGFPASQKAAFPYIVITRPTHEVFNNLTGIAGIRREEWQLDCMSQDIDEAEELMDAVIDHVNETAPTTLSGFDVPLMIVDSTADLSELEESGSQATTYRKTIQLTVKRSPST